jgi:outer membrane protein assembly factor BamB
MRIYTHFEFTAKRHRHDRVQLNPSLKLASRWCLTNVGYLPKVYGDKTLLSFKDGLIRAYDRAFQSLWSFRLPAGFEPTPPFDGGILISENSVITRFGEKLFCLDIECGKIFAQHEVPELDLEAAIIQDSRFISLILEGGKFFCAAYNYKIGNQLWTHPVSEPPDYITGDSNLIVLSDCKGELCCLNGVTGKQLWRVRLMELVDGETEYKELKRGDIEGIPIINGGLVIVPVIKNHVIALELQTGKLVWMQKLDIEVPNNTVLYPDGNIYIVDYKILVIINAQSGQILESRNLFEEFKDHNLLMPTRFAVSEDFIYVADIYKGNLVALNKNDGRIGWSYELKTQIPYLKGPIIIGEQLFLLDIKGNLYTFSQE